MSDFSNVRIFTGKCELNFEVLNFQMIYNLGDEKKIAKRSVTLKGLIAEMSKYG